MNGRIAISIFLFFWSSAIYAQLTPRARLDNYTEQRIENIAEALQDDNVDYQELFDNLTFYSEHPIDLNTADREDLLSLPMLSETQISNFLAFRKKYGPLVSLYELRRITGFDYDSIQLLLPFVTISLQKGSQKLTLKSIMKDSRKEMDLRWERVLQLQKGYRPPATPDANHYLGSRDKVFYRYRMREGTRFSAGITAEKDAGEPFGGTYNPRGFDFYSGHVFFKPDGLVKSVALGDFQAQFGQGLTYWSGLAFGGKSAYAVDVKQRPLGLRPYSSVNESLFLRGAGVTLEKGALDLTLFGSDNKVDASLQQADTTFDANRNAIASALIETGYHRTALEMAKKNTVLQRQAGFHLGYRKNTLAIGITGAYEDLDAKIVPQAQLYNRFRYSGNLNSALGVDYDWQVGNFNFFGETTRGRNGVTATLNGVKMALDPRVQLAVVQRAYPKDFHTLGTIAFGETQPPQNENGIYFGADLHFFNQLEIGLYFDQFQFPWLRYRTNAPTQGSDFLAQADYNFSKRLRLQVRYKHKAKPINLTDLDVNLPYPGETYKENLRATVYYRASESIQLRSRAEFTNFYRADRGHQHGMMLYQDFIYHPEERPWRLTLRYAIFDTQSYDAAIYAYENDVLYAYSIPAYSGRGVRYYALFQYSLNRHLDLYMRYAQTTYDDREVISSGLDEIQGPAKSDVKVEARWTF